VIGSFLTRSELEGFERSITANNDYTRFGGSDARFPVCPRGNVVSATGQPLPGAPPGGNNTFAAVSGRATSGTPTFADFNYGTLNECSLDGYLSMIPTTQREGILAQGSYDLTSSVQLFTELMYSHSRTTSYLTPPHTFSEPGFVFSTASASNPYNPFGQTVGVSNVFTGVGRTSESTNTDFFRPLVGARGGVLSSWKWEITAWDSEHNTTLPLRNETNGSALQAALNSSNPATALNPFVDGPAGSPQLLQSLLVDWIQKTSGSILGANAFAHGPIAHLPSGAVEAVIGVEHDHDTFATENVSFPFSPLGRTTYRRDVSAVFGEARVPVIANHANPQSGDMLTLTIAGRYDHYDDFGSHSTPQYGVEWRPFDTLLIRSTYGQSFRAPTLFELHEPNNSVQAPIPDPLRGNQIELVTIVLGGNAQLRPETGQSRTVGFVYSSKSIPDLRFSLSYWRIDENNSITILSPFTLIANESLFPGNVTRAPGQNGQLGPITRVNAAFVNFGQTQVAGFDYQAAYRFHPTNVGEFFASLGATQTYHYTTVLVPNTKPVDAVSKAQDSGNWAPRWKGTVALGWKSAPYVVNMNARYVGKYQDYDQPLANGTTQIIGNFWLFDANLRYAAGTAIAQGNSWLRGTYCEIGGVNLFNRLPQYSNMSFGTVGFDAAQADIRGRFLYAQIGTKW